MSCLHVGSPEEQLSNLGYLYAPNLPDEMRASFLLAHLEPQTVIFTASGI